MTIGENALIKCVHDSLEMVCNEFQEISGFSCDKMPEYLLTAGLYRNLKKLKNVGWVQPEANIKESMSQASALGRGPMPSAINAAGRFDIIVYGTSGSPIGAIEVKKTINSYSQLSSDLSRLRSVLKKSPGSSSIKYVGLAFLIGNGDGERKAANDRVDTRANNIGIKLFGIEYQKLRDGIYRYGQEDHPESYSYKISESNDESFSFASCFWMSNR